ncbi:MAG TPA: beta-N-acetylglucosaminidase domain-containing protein [Rhizomicrobium sp.]|nr:beta-N-acetylglucosaminidase domain-containing protein [Rhizomicrobium sp.]
MRAALGIIEGFYGKPWSWAARAETAAFLAPHGYGFYYYAPKADPYLRERWQEDHPSDMAEHLRMFAARCRELDVRFGVGLSPFEIYRDFGRDARAALVRKLAFLKDVGIDDLAILFDDMRGDIPGLAETQVGILHWIAERTSAKRLVVCPTYYSDDPVLDRVFGQRPGNYLEEFGARLDPDIEIFWTGEEVCSREFTVGHLTRVCNLIGRKPVLWDNYPVNDGKRMSQYLHLRGFTGRPAAIADVISAHAINPALQPVLSRIPALTLAASYASGDAYEYGRALAFAASDVAGKKLGDMLHQDILLLQDSGLDRLDTMAERLRKRYSEFDHPAAREVLAWLDGEYRFEALAPTS